ncbi:MAG: hypothetical protein SFW07_02705 [Gammaproteobacteria bacterium]|nr:hypothetical protein [Gammaproteobacteria bacterium]
MMKRCQRGSCELQQLRLSRHVNFVKNTIYHVDNLILEMANKTATFYTLGWNISTASQAEDMR